MRTLLALLALVSTHGCGQQPASEHPRCEPCPECAGPVAAPVETPAVEPPVEDEAPAAAVVAAGQCDVSWLPPGLATDVSDEAAAALVELVRGWVENENRPALEVARGVVFAKSEDDTGADPPYPSFVGRDSVLACGRNALWLGDHVRDLVALHATPDMGDGIRCSENVCCYAAAMEYDSSATLVFRPVPDDRWALQAVAIVADNGTLGEDWIRDERAWVVRQLGARGSERCRGEPAGLVW